MTLRRYVVFSAICTLQNFISLLPIRSLSNQLSIKPLQSIHVLSRFHDVACLMPCSTMFLSYLTANEVVLGAGYPVQVETNTDSDFNQLNQLVTQALIYAYGTPGNQLCFRAQQQQLQQFQGGRRKRQVPGK